MLERTYGTKERKSKSREHAIVSKEISLGENEFHRICSKVLRRDLYDGTASFVMDNEKIAY
jgi:hypothetical protein